MKKLILLVSIVVAVAGCRTQPKTKPVQVPFVYNGAC